MKSFVFFEVLHLLLYSHWQLFHQSPQTAPPWFCSSSSVCYLMAIQQHVRSEWNASHAQEQWKQREDEYVVKMFSHTKKLENTWFQPWLLPAIFEIRYFIPDSFPGFWTHLCLLRLCLCSAFPLGPENIEDGMGGIPSDIKWFFCILIPGCDALHKICSYACVQRQLHINWVNGNKRACICSTVCI